MESVNVKVLDNFGMIGNGVTKYRVSPDALNCADSVQPAGLQIVTRYHPSNVCCMKNNFRSQYLPELVLKNYAMFMKSGIPQRFLFHESGEWKDYPFDIVSLVREDFLERKSMVQVVVQNHKLLLDFVHMVEIDAETGMQKPLGWIDENGIWAFPEIKSHFSESHFHSDSTIAEEEVHMTCEANDSREQIVKHEIPGAPTENSSSSANSIVKQVKNEQVCAENSEEYGSDGESKLHNALLSQHLPYENLQGEISVCVRDENVTHDALGKISMCDKQEQVFNTVQQLLLLGLRSIINAEDINGIFHIQPTSRLWGARLSHFKEQVGITTSLRGFANVRYCWLACSQVSAGNTLLHGLGNATEPIYKTMYGTGIHLAPPSRSDISASCSDVDENGVIYMVLCRVILGNLEVVHHGSNQYQPSSELYDNGTDNLQNPSYYTVWQNYADTHILPEYIVSFRVPSKTKECFVRKEKVNDVSRRAFSNCSQDNRQTRFSGRQSMKKVRSIPATAKMFSSCMPFSMLFAALSTKISTKDLDPVHIHFEEFKRKKMSRIDFIKKLRDIIGDKLLVSTVLHLQNKPPRSVGSIRHESSTSLQKASK